MAKSKPFRNEWNEPFHVYGPGEGKLRHRVLRQEQDYRISRDTWEKETRQSNNFLGNIQERWLPNLSLFNIRNYLFFTFLKIKLSQSFSLIKGI